MPFRGPPMYCGGTLVGKRCANYKGNGKKSENVHKGSQLNGLFFKDNGHLEFECNERVSEIVFLLQWWLVDLESEM